MTINAKLIPLIFAIALIVPIGVVSAQENTDNANTEFNPPDFEDFTDDSVKGPVGIVDELYEAHDELTSIMQRQSLGDFTTPDLPFVMTYVDEEKGDLVVVMHVMAAMVGIEYDEDEVQIALGYDIPVEIMYGDFQLDASQSRINSWKQYYMDYCIPVQAGYQAVCTLYAGYLADNGVDVSTLTSSVPTTTTPTSDTSPCDVSAGSLACYYYTQYLNRCIPTHTTSRCNTYATQITTAGYTVPTSVPTTTPTPSTPVEPNPTNVVAVLNGNSITVTWTSPSVDIENYKVYPYVDNSRGSRSYVTTESFTVSPVSEGSSYKFKVKAYYDERLNGRSSSSYVYSNVIDVPRTTVLDTINPVITTQGDITVQTTNTDGTQVGFTVTATDETDGSTSVICNPTSGSNFPIGTTRVECTSSDSAENAVTEFFNIIVNLFTPTSSVTEFYGGNQYVMWYQNSTGIFGTPSTLTIGAINSTGFMGVVVSGHGLGLDVGATFVSHSIGENVTNVEITREIVPVHFGGNVDAAFIPITEPNIVVGSKVQASNRTIIDVTQGNLTSIQRGLSLTIYGVHNNGDGNLLFKDATLSQRGISFTNMGVALYPSIGGDSGSPIIHHLNGESKLVGVHQGGICLFSSISEGQTQINVTNNSQFCTGDDYYYKVFSAWENVRQILNLN